MINASKEFKEKLKSGANIVNYADVTLSDGEVLHLTYKDFMVGGCQIDDKTTDGKFGVGFCVGKTAALRLANHDERFSDYDFYGSIINLYVAMQLDDGTIEKIRKGVFYTVVPETPGDIIQINAVDGMYRLDRDYSESTLAYPATLQQIITGACLDCGIPIGFTQFDNMGFTVAEKPENAKYRQVVSYACQIAGYNAHIDNDGYMQLVWYDTSLLDMVKYDGGDFKKWPHDTILDGGDFTFSSPTMIIDGGNFADPAPENVYQIKSLSVSTDDIVITGVQVVGEEEENTAIVGEPRYMIKLENNPFVTGKEQQVASYLGSRMIGLVFRAFSASVLNNPLYEPFEVARVYDRKGNMYLTIINSVSYTVGGYTQIACEAEDPVRNGSSFYSPSAAAVVEARRNTKKQITEYDKAVQNMNQIAMNAMGFHTTYEEREDGSRITYLHDKPNLSDSKIIYKQTIDGFFLSQDGGKSYTAGFDSNGNAVLNILYAIGIVADWIHSGTLTLGGNGNTNGVLVVLDASGKQVGRWDKDGIIATKGTFSGALNAATGTFKGKLSAATGSFTGTVNATTFDSANANITGGTIHIRTASYGAITLGRTEGQHCDINPYYAEYYKDSANYGMYKPGGISYYKNGSMGSYWIADSSSYDTLSTDMIIAKATKSRLINTKDFGSVLQYCYETPSPMFGDIGCGELDENGLCYVYFDMVFIETVSTDREYQVFLQKEGKGDIWVEEKTEEYFIVKGDPNLKFSWEVKVKQRNYEYERLDVFDENQGETEIDYENEAISYLDQYEKEIFNYEETY